MFSFHAFAIICFCKAVISALECSWSNSSTASDLCLSLLEYHLSTHLRITCIFTLVSLTNQACFIPRRKKDILVFLLCRAQLVMLPRLKDVINVESLSNHGAETSQDQSRSTSQFHMLQFPTTQHF